MLNKFFDGHILEIYSLLDDVVVGHVWAIYSEKTIFGFLHI
jgi:hypothetical protein